MGKSLGRLSSHSSSSISKLVARLAIAMTCLALTVLTPSFAYADEAAAETLFQEGLAAMKRNDYVVACEAFAQSNKADASPGTQINLALCYEKQKKWASAWTWYRSAVGLAQQRGQKEREQLAEDSANRLKPQLHYVVISVKEQLPDTVVKRDGAEVTTMVAGKEVPLAIDPGEHSIEVSARGKKPHFQKIVMEDNNKTDRIEIPKLVDAPVDSKQPGGGTGTGNDYRPPVVIANDGSTQRTVGIVVGGAGLLAGLAGIGLFILAKNEEGERDEQRRKADGTAPGPQRDAFVRSGNSHAKAADNNQLIAIVLGAGAVVLVGVGAVLFFTAPKHEKAAKSRVVPLLGPNFGGLGLTGTF
jgi:hypothetical protein